MGRHGVFNFEGGCYAKIIKLSKDRSPRSMQPRSGSAPYLKTSAINTVSRRIDLNDESFTENTRASYHISSIPNAFLSGMGGHPTTIIMLTCDAFGVLPPVARLTSEQAIYHFLSGYTAKVAGTETGITEPEAIFSNLFRRAIMTLHPTVYAELLKHKIDAHHVRCWLVNTGWIGGGYRVGSRIKIAYSRAIVNAAIDALSPMSHSRRNHSWGSWSRHPARTCPRRFSTRAMSGRTRRVMMSRDKPGETVQEQLRNNTRAMFLKM